MQPEVIGSIPIEGSTLQGTEIKKCNNIATTKKKGKSLIQKQVNQAFSFFLGHYLIFLPR